jgi:hypothetical protein
MSKNRCARGMSKNRCARGMSKNRCARGMSKKRLLKTHTKKRLFKMDKYHTLFNDPLYNPYITRAERYALENSLTAILDFYYSDFPFLLNSEAQLLQKKAEEVNRDLQQLLSDVTVTTQALLQTLDTNGLAYDSHIYNRLQNEIFPSLSKLEKSLGKIVQITSEYDTYRYQLPDRLVEKMEQRSNTERLYSDLLEKKTVLLRQPNYGSLRIPISLIEARMSKIGKGLRQFCKWTTEDYFDRRASELEVDERIKSSALNPAIKTAFDFLRAQVLSVVKKSRELILNNPDFGDILDLSTDRNVIDKLSLITDIELLI